MRPAGKEGATAVTAVSTVEAIKAASNQLRGTIGQELSDAAPAFSPESQQLLRFHGIYQQDDRDVRTRAERGSDSTSTTSACGSASPAGP